MRVSPSTILAGLALFFALGGSAIAVSNAVKPQPRCAPGAVRGFIAVNGDPAKGIANLGDQFTSAAPAIGVRFNCNRGAPQARRLDRGVFEVRFPNSASELAVVSAGTAETTIGRLGPGLFRITLWVPGRQDAVDTPFQVVAV